MSFTKLSIFAAVVLSVLSNSVSFASAPLTVKDDCFRAVINIATGLQGALESTQKTKLTVESVTEVRLYRARFTKPLATYEIELSNDSAYRCLPQSVTIIDQK